MDRIEDRNARRSHPSKGDLTSAPRCSACSIVYWYEFVAADRQSRGILHNQCFDRLRGTSAPISFFAAGADAEGGGVLRPELGTLQCEASPGWR